MALPLYSPEPAEIANFDYEGILSVVEHDMRWLLKRNEDLILYRDYFEAEQDTKFPTKELIQALGEEAYERFKFNLCEVVVGAVEERIDLRSISIPGNETLSAQLWAEIQANDKTYVEEETYNGALVESRSYLFVWPRPCTGHQGLGHLREWRSPSPYPCAQTLVHHDQPNYGDPLHAREHLQVRGRSAHMGFP